MTVYRTGSSGDQVKKIQKALGINADGVYGQQTRDAVMAYQKANNLQVDGEVGDETWGSLFPAQQTQQTTQQSTQNTVPQYNAPAPTSRQDYAYDPNTNEAYLNALKALEQANKNAPTYGASYDQQLEELYDKIVNREDFSYDLNADALYEQYQQKFTALGDQAMQDTMGQAAALTGGYASSYAQNAGQQAYNQYLTQLNDIVPDLYTQAYGRYQDEGQALLNQYGMLGDMADDEYGKYMDAYNQWLAQLQMSREDVDTAYDRGYTDFINAQQMAYQQDQAN
ncbi:MAG: peptidoglycan-binding protein, partial [Oscillospiraceae bacterium]|nr:peptidoglycan-binding protein [Oscillospiraceae bacterium]